MKKGRWPFFYNYPDTGGLQEPDIDLGTAVSISGDFFTWIRYYIQALNPGRDQVADLYTQCQYS